MELEFAASARRLERERLARKREVERKKRKQEKLSREADAMQARVARLVEERRRARAQEAREAARLEEQSQGIQLDVSLCVKPRAKADTNRIVLPKSVLETLEAQRALDIVQGPLTFAVSVNVDGVGVVTTHCGVDEFTEDDGCCAVPPAVALSLTGGNQVDWLVGRQVRVRFAQLPHHAKVKVAFQPRGQGFHRGEDEVVNIDIKTVLLRTLRDMLTLTEGDVVPIRNEGVTYELVVRHISPDPAILILNTDVEVDLMPSERAEEELRRREDRATWLAARRARIDAKQAVLETADKNEDNKNHDGVPKRFPLRLRMPSGKTFTRTFQADTPLEQVLDWAAINLPEPPSDLPLHVEDNAEFYLVQALAGRTQARYDVSMAARSLADLGFAGRESLLVNWNYFPSGEAPSQATEENVPEEGTSGAALASASSPPAAPQETQTPLQDIDSDEDRSVGNSAEPKATATFTDAMQAAEAQLDRSLEEENLRKAMEASRVDKGPNATEETAADKVHIFHSLVAKGVAPTEAAQAAQKYPDQIIELETMGFVDHARNLELLDRYQGRLERVVNLLAGGD
ncbi:Ubiquitin recognition factor in ER-associated degradation protein 1 [Hondaea fermentalgiana]|uniref:Ubiquitin recognition factor in ER-associated degradation protein 1 n=1 Tax=Hondaea fermentalgiana TaxID=2315210 RepID=A0A2R5GSZ5_9STRA|nr:Ubiquitin recognition factor in ER-associated degradation protein 1 [Hondaea fermentalgiana]|eukprot:GBG33982.1 Ubiquitin recognition factor in ER-associated degradation protein 1 [Hondaea fermentalgiana]